MECSEDVNIVRNIVLYLKGAFVFWMLGFRFSTIMLKLIWTYSPNSVHTVGVLAVTLGLAVWSGGDLDVYGDQLLCAGAALRACCLAPVQAKRSVASLFTEKHNRFSTLFV